MATTDRPTIPAARVWLGLVWAVALIASVAWFLHSTTTTAGASTRGTTSVMASGVSDPPWTSGTMDPPWT